MTEPPQSTQSPSDPRAALVAAVRAIRADLPGTLIALDFDGTLAPIVADPLDSRPAPGALAALRELAARGARLAVVTGRDAATAVRLGGLDAVPGLRVVGLYGLETWHDGELRTPDVPPAVDRLRERLPAVVAAASSDPGVRIEDKRLSLVVHTRRAADPDGALAVLRGPVTALCADLGLECHDGKLVLEIRLPGYDKGGVLRRLVDDLAPRQLLYAGDDVGDLPAFAELARLRADGRAAWSVAVVSDERPDLADAADLTVDGPLGIVALLRRLAMDARSAPPQARSS